LSANDLSSREIAQQLYRYDKPILQLPTAEQITAEIRQEYIEKGFLGVQQVLEPQLVQESIEALMNLIHVDNKGAHVQFTKPVEQLLTAEERELAVRKVANYVEHDETLRSVANHPNILRIARELLGEEPVLVQNMALLKPPHGGGEKPWHQDMAYGPLAFDKAVVGVWIALDEAGIDNGCMHVIPRSHMDGGVPHYARRDWQICDTSVHVEKDVPVPLAPGGVLFFHGLLHHGTPPNFSVKRRRALQFHFAPASAVKMTPAEYKRMYTNAMTNAEC
jgi:phytanoyl-CoA hydroxylase